MAFNSKIRKTTIQRGSQAGGISNAASKTIQDIVLTHKARSSAGNAVTVTVVAGGVNNRALSVSIAGDAITITPATNGTGVITTTTAQAVTALNADSNISKKVVASGGSATVIAATGATALAGGSDWTIGG
jgi:hypothetical protein